MIITVLTYGNKIESNVRNMTNEVFLLAEFSQEIFGHSCNIGFCGIIVKDDPFLFDKDGCYLNTLNIC